MGLLRTPTTSQSWSFWLAISEPGWTSPKKVPLLARLESPRPSEIQEKPCGKFCWGEIQNGDLGCGPNHTNPERLVLSVFVCPVSKTARKGWPPEKKCHSESGLNQRDRATGGFVGVCTHRKPGRTFYWRGFGWGKRRRTPALGIAPDQHAPAGFV